MIQAAGLTRKFGEFTAVDAIALSVTAGEIFGLLGPNGAGKSTTIKMLTTLLPVTSGTAQVAGCDVILEPAGVRARIGYVPQMVSADGALTARENLVLSAKLYHVASRERDERVDQALSFMGLSDAADKLVRTYSGGMIRKLELAQVMLHRPKVLFLDEPTIGLDPVARRAVWEKLKELRNDYGMTILLTTHDMDEADLLCDRIAILHRGRVSITDRPAQLKAAVGPHADLGDVFAHFSGGSIQEGGSYRDVRQTRSTASRLS